ncbi:MAG: LTA synthase family protein [Prevotellaceae bacterium]|nr:LTA synthase family protein [Prevotellaceae bacterium]
MKIMTKYTTKQTFLLGGCLFFKFIYFDFLWCLQTTFTSFSTFELYINGVFVTLLLLLPFVCAHRRWVQTVVLLAVDGLLVANLMYARTYFAAIPLDSYAAVGNLSDFGASVWDSVRWTDVVFFLSTLFGVLYGNRLRRLRQPSRDQGSYLRLAGSYLLLLAGFGLVSFALSLRKGGFVASFEYLQGANKHTCTTPEYTVFGSLLHDALKKREVYTPETAAQIRTWLDARPPYRALPDTIPERTNLVIILAESFESWVLEQRVEGQEITPNLNRLLADPHTLYAPHVLTQTKGGRSIDGQMLLMTGMLPIAEGAYSIKYPQHTFHSLPEAMKAKFGTRTYLMTVDKPIVWNQQVVAKSFGYDTLISKKDFVDGEKIGMYGRQKLGDVPFLRQCAEKMAHGEIARDGESYCLLCVTYSGHNPFKLPEALQQLHFPADYPERMRDYMNTAHYTDRAIGAFVDYLRARPDYDRTLIVITGDHEGLTADRADLCASPRGKGIVSDKQFTPFIVLNSPVALRYDAVMGQADMYTTLLNLLKLDDAPWKGMGQSILDPSRPPFAVGMYNNPVGDLSKVSPAEEQRAKQAYTISDLMIRFDYFGRDSE